MRRQILVAAAVAAACGSQSARAQLLPPDDSLIKFYRYTAVRERVIPGFTPSSIDVGGLALSPSLDVTGEYTDNIYALQTPRVGDEFVDIAPSVLVQASGESRTLSLNATGHLDRYVAHPSENSEAIDASAYATQQLGGGTRVRLLARYDQARESRESENAYVLTQRPIRFESAAAAVGVTQRFASVQLSGEGGFQRSTYFDGALFDGTVLGQHYRDNDVETVRVRAEVAQSPSLAYFAQATHAWVDYRVAGAGRGSRNLELLGGVRFELPIRARGEIGVGYVRADFQGATRSFSGVGINSSVTLFPTELLTVTVTAQRSLNNAGTPSSTGYVALSGGIQADYELLRQVILSAGVQLERDSFNGLDRNDGRVAGTASVEYRSKGGWALHGGIQYLDLTSSGVDRYKSFNRSRIMGGLRFFL